MTDPKLLHVLDLATLRDWHGAKSALESMDDTASLRLFGLVSELDHLEEERRKGDAYVRHEIGNALSIVRANLEAIIDEILPATPERLKGMSDALSDASLLLDEPRSPAAVEGSSSPAETIDLKSLVATQAAMLASLAQSKMVAVVNVCSGRVYGEPERCAQAIRDVLIGCIRFTPPHGEIEIRSRAGHEHLVFAVSGLRAGTVIPRALGRGRGVSGAEISGDRLTFILTLPAESAGE